MIRRFVDVTQTRGCIVRTCSANRSGRRNGRKRRERKRKKRKEKKCTVEKRGVGDGDAMRWKGGGGGLERREADGEAHGDVSGAMVSEREKDRGGRRRKRRNFFVPPLLFVFVLICSLDDPF